ncbi:MAG: DUF721 domain-containing protein [Legionella sp.]|nr:DUF721 domain-containing protein [Legionella sp.]
MRRINRCLNKQLVDICQQAVELDDLNLKLDHYLPETLHGKCNVGSFNKGCLVIVTANPAWATELRYYLPTLRDILRKDAGLYRLISIKVQILAEQYPENPGKLAKSSMPELSSSARNSVRNAGELCSYLPLRDALLNLAKCGEK